MLLGTRLVFLHSCGACAPRTTVDPISDIAHVLFVLRTIHHHRVEELVHNMSFMRSSRAENEQVDMAEAETICPAAAEHERLVLVDGLNMGTRCATRPCHRSLDLM